MNRDEFREILESIKIPEGTSSEDMQRMVSPLNVALLQMAPERLFKYRECCNKHIAAFRDDQLWMSTSDFFNDPFDTLIQFDDMELRNACKAILQPEIVKMMTRCFADGCQLPPVINKIVDENEIDRLRVIAQEGRTVNSNEVSDDQQSLYIQLLFAYCMDNLPVIAQRFSTAVCLSEKIDSVLMWSHYAHNHEGFALGYDLRPYLFPNEDSLGLYPVVYGEKRYDASEFLIWLFCALLRIPAHNPDMMNSIKLLLYKSVDWKYEQEWRLINCRPGDLFVGRSEPLKIKPNSIYYGCRISDENRNRLHDIALKKGIEEHFMSVDNAAGSYMMNVKD